MASHAACVLTMALLACFAPCVSALQPTPAVDQLVDLSLEQLLDIHITSVAKHTQKLSEAAAAVFVVSQEDLRGSGATTMAEALRMVPGVEVARIDANKRSLHAGSTRGSPTSCSC
jgi:iron complex outermembrane recepter protein